MYMQRLRNTAHVATMVFTMNITDKQSTKPQPPALKYHPRHLFLWAPFGRHAVDFSHVREKQVKFMKPYAIRKHMDRRKATKLRSPMSTRRTATT
mmetsp:Transcript_11283/g.31359  ORF Transcript_11283/g.31359 Transcript_11283/m.31359 type:complete len:95 (-) Transcript_11283:1281-1565(-)